MHAREGRKYLEAKNPRRKKPSRQGGKLSPDTKKPGRDRRKKTSEKPKEEEEENWGRKTGGKTKETTGPEKKETKEKLGK